MELSTHTDTQDEGRGGDASSGGSGGGGRSAGLAAAPSVTGLTPYDIRTWFEQVHRADDQPWWTSSAWFQVVASYGHDPLVQVMAEIVNRLRLGEHAQEVAGGHLPHEAAGVAVEWLVRGFAAIEVGRWLNVGGWKPPMVRAVVDAGGCPEMFGSDDGHLTVTQPGPVLLAQAGRVELTGEPVVDYVMYGDLTAAEAIALVTGRYVISFPEEGGR